MREYDANKSNRPDCSGRVLLCLGLESIIIALGVDGLGFYKRATRGVYSGRCCCSVIVAGGHISGFIHGDFSSAGSTPSLYRSPVAIFITLKGYIEINGVARICGFYKAVAGGLAAAVDVDRIIIIYDIYDNDMTRSNSRGLFCCNGGNGQYGTHKQHKSDEKSSFVETYQRGSNAICVLIVTLVAGFANGFLSRRNTGRAMP